MSSLNGSMCCSSSFGTMKHGLPSSSQVAQSDNVLECVEWNHGEISQSCCMAIRSRSCDEPGVSGEGEREPGAVGGDEDMDENEGPARGDEVPSHIHISVDKGPNGTQSGSWGY
jgi:hypothetical protein